MDTPLKHWSPTHIVEYREWQQVERLERGGWNAGSFRPSLKVFKRECTLSPSGKLAVLHDGRTKRLSAKSVIRVREIEQVQA